MELEHFTKFGPNTLAYLSQIEATLSVEGDVAECGVYRGENTYHYANYLTSMNSNKRLFGLDSFEGLPRETIENADLTRFDDVELVNVKKTLSGFKNTTLVPGYFRDTLAGLCENLFSCVIIDCDIYESYKTCLNFFYPRLSRGSIIVFDEYYSKKYPLAKKAVDEFFIDKLEKPELFKREQNLWERWRIVKQ